MKPLSQGKLLYLQIVAEKDDIIQLVDPYFSTNEEYFTLSEFKIFSKNIVEILKKSDDLAMQHYAMRVDACANHVIVSTVDDVMSYYADYCKFRWCPVCQWRRSMKWRARFFQILPALQEEHPTARFLFLTVTVPNCPLDLLRSKLIEMNKAWHRLIKRKEFHQVIGWLRTTEVTREGEKEGFANREMYAHPHFHVLLMVNPSYFAGRNYVSQKTWLKVWSESMRDPSIQVVHIKAVIADSNVHLFKQVCETLKYSVKPMTMAVDGRWFLEFIRQTQKLRLIASGGVIKSHLSSNTKSYFRESLWDSDYSEWASTERYAFDATNKVGNRYYKKRKKTDMEID